MYYNAYIKMKLPKKVLRRFVKLTSPSFRGCGNTSVRNRLKLKDFVPRREYTIQCFNIARLF